MCLDFLRKVTIVLLFLCWTKLALSLSYDELEQLGVSCAPRDSCLNRTDGEALNYYTCECDSKCVEKGSCCIDSPYLNLNFSYKKECIRSPIMNVDCDTSGNVWIVTKCSPKWNGSAHMKELCEGDPLKIGNFLMLVPAFSPTTGNTYKNYFCAVCHEDDDNAVFWNITLSREEHISFLGLCEADAPQDLVYMEDNRKWGYWNHFAPGEAIFIPVTITINEDFSRSEQCRQGIVWNCAVDWSDEEIRKKCEAYMAVVEGSVEYSQGEKRKRAFRNIHCAICNHVKHFDDFMCPKYQKLQYVCGKVPSLSVTVLFSHKKIDKEKCLTKGHKFIAGLEKCRPVIYRG